MILARFMDFKVFEVFKLRILGAASPPTSYIDRWQNLK